MCSSDLDGDETEADGLGFEVGIADSRGRGGAASSPAAARWIAQAAGQYDGAGEGAAEKSEKTTTLGHGVDRGDEPWDGEEKQKLRRNPAGGNHGCTLENLDLGIKLFAASGRTCWSEEWP